MRVRFMLPAAAAAGILIAAVPAVSAGATNNTLGSTVSGGTTLAGPPQYPAQMYPSGLTWDASSKHLVVADTGFDRVSVFNPDGTLDFSFGSYGTGNGQFDTPREVAVDGSSNIYVADAGNSRIQAFDSSGHWLWTAGTGTGCPKGKTCLNTPIGITYDSVDHVLLVADTGHSLIKAFTTSGTWLWNSPGGILASPREATLGPDGRIWVADYHHQEVKAFNVSGVGTSTPTWNTTPAITLGDGKANGHNPGELNAPYNVGFSPDGKTVYVADTGNERIQLWNCCQSSPTQPSTWEFGSRCTTSCPAVYPNRTPDLQFQQLRRVTIDSSGNLWVADFWGSGVHEITPSGTAGPVEIDGYNSSLPGFEEAYGVAVSSSGSVYGVDRLDQRVEQFNASGGYVDTVGKRGVAVGQFSWPESVAVSPTDSSVWVADTRNDRIEQWPASLTGKPTTVVGKTSRGSTPVPGTFNYIEGLTVAGSGVVWIADTNNNRIQSYNPSNGNFAAYGTRGSGQCQFIGPQDVAVNGSDFYIADTANNRIEEVQLSGGTCTYVGEYDGLNAPQGVAVAPNGTVWVANTGANQVVQLSSDLSTELNSFGGLGTGNNQFDQPHSLAVSADGSTLYVADTYNSRIQEFTLS